MVVKQLISDSRAETQESNDTKIKSKTVHVVFHR